jgi:glycine/D-amino acid oxidase-like deaminating enzyme
VGTIPIDQSCDVLIIGAGFYGAEIALEFRRLGFRRVVLVDREPEIMRRASYVNQARVHNGYHYPRSLATAERSRANFEMFVAEYADAVVADMESVYAIAAGSRVSPAQFAAFCRTIGVPCQPAPRRIAALFDAGRVQDAFMARELVFDATKLAARLNRSLADAGVELRMGTEAGILGADRTAVVVQCGSERIRAGHVVNCTYAEIEFAGVTLRTRVKKELAELVLIAPPPELNNLGVTVMDGPFFSTLPFPAARLRSLSHVRYTPHAASDAIEREHLLPLRSNSEAMLRDSARYLPCLARARVVRSMFEMKATLIRNEDDDGRPILIERSADMPRVLSILGAKIDNIYDVRRYLRGQDWAMAA